MTGSVDLPTETDAVRIIANGVPDPIKEPDCALGIVLSPASGLLSEFLYCRILKIEEFCGFQKLGGGFRITLGEKDNEYCSLFLSTDLVAEYLVGCTGVNPG